MPQFDGQTFRVAGGISLVMSLKRQLGSIVRLRPAIYSRKNLLKLGYIRHYEDLKTLDV